MKWKASIVLILSNDAQKSGPFNKRSGKVLKTAYNGEWLRFFEANNITVIANSYEDARKILKKEYPLDCMKIKKIEQIET